MTLSHCSSSPYQIAAIQAAQFDKKFWKKVGQHCETREKVAHEHKTLLAETTDGTPPVMALESCSDGQS